MSLAWRTLGGGRSRLRSCPLSVLQVPTPSQSFVKQHDDGAPVEFGLGQRILSWKKLLLRLEYIVIAGLAGNVPLEGYLYGILVGVHGPLLINTNRIVFLARNESVGNIL